MGKAGAANCCSELAVVVSAYWYYVYALHYGGKRYSSVGRGSVDGVKWYWPGDVEGTAG